MDIKIRPRPMPLPEPDPPAAGGTRVLPSTATARVREALRCPYCRDDAPPREGALACGRRGCGALYHAECWEECSAAYGGCAVFGCGSVVAKGVGRAGLWLRALRLLVAAILFPPRALEALRQEGDGVAAMHRALRARADEVQGVMWDPQLPDRVRSYGLAWFLAYPAKWGVLLASYGVVALLVVSLRLHAMFILPLLVVIPMLFVLGLFFGTWPLALALCWARAVLAGEFAALGRVAAGGTVLARLRAGAGIKKTHT